jgi:hypothetical protein
MERYSFTTFLISQTILSFISIVFLEEFFQCTRFYHFSLGGLLYTMIIDLQYISYDGYKLSTNQGK